jgi:tRNA(Ile2) C34 agmatinyltransferase TiaS
MLELMKTLAEPATACELCGGYLLCLGDERYGWKLACMRCGTVAFEEVLPEPVAR